MEQRESLGKLPFDIVYEFLGPPLNFKCMDQIDFKYLHKDFEK